MIRKRTLKRAKQRPRWIVFDLDDTLIHSSKIYSICYKKLNLSNAFWTAKSKAKSRISKNHSSSHNRLIYFKGFLEIQTQFSPKRALELNQKYENLLKKEIQRDLRKTKVLQTLRKLKNDYKLAIFTNETLRSQLIKLQILDPKGILFDAILTSEEIGQEKDQKGSYKKLLKFIKASPMECLMVGDSQKQDLTPAIQIGFTDAVKISSPGQLKPLLTALSFVG